MHSGMVMDIYIYIYNIMYNYVFLVYTNLADASLAGHPDSDMWRVVHGKDSFFILHVWYV